MSLDQIAQIGFRSVGMRVYISRLASFYSPHKINIGNDVRIDDFAVLSGNITIGNQVHIAVHCSVSGSEQEVVISDYSGLSAGVRVFSAFDDFSGLSLTNPTVHSKFRNVSSGKVIIGKHVVIGANSIIGPGVTLGEGAAVGALTFVNRNVAPWHIVAGVPARFIKLRKKDILEKEIQFKNSIVD